MGEPTGLNSIARDFLQSDCQELKTAFGSACDCPFQGYWEGFCDVLGREAASIACCAKENDVEVFDLRHCEDCLVICLRGEAAWGDIGMKTMFLEHPIYYIPFNRVSRAQHCTTAVLTKLCRDRIETAACRSLSTLVPK